MARKIWGKIPYKPDKEKIPDSIKSEITNKALEFVDKRLKPLHIIKNPTVYNTNFVADITVKWFRNYFYFTAIYELPESDISSKQYERKFARIEYVDEKSYNLSFFRHTDQWWEMYQKTSIENCFKTIESEEIFFP